MEDAFPKILAHKEDSQDQERRENCLFVAVLLDVSEKSLVLLADLLWNVINKSAEAFVEEMSQTAGICSVKSDVMPKGDMMKTADVTSVENVLKGVLIASVNMDFVAIGQIAILVGEAGLLMEEETVVTGIVEVAFVSWDYLGELTVNAAVDVVVEKTEIESTKDLSSAWVMVTEFAKSMLHQL